MKSRSQALKVHLWGLEFDNPVGIGAGLDKHAEGMDSLLNLGSSQGSQFSLLSCRP
jgi:dihydroorotate dehydrogenase